LLVCTTLLARRDKIVDYCQTEDLGAGLIIKRKKEERRKKKQGLFTLWLSKSQGQYILPQFPPVERGLFT
jgi:hypothetical protein